MHTDGDGERRRNEEWRAGIVGRWIWRVSWLPARSRQNWILMPRLEKTAPVQHGFGRRLGLGPRAVATHSLPSLITVREGGFRKKNTTETALGLGHSAVNRPSALPKAKLTLYMVRL